MARVSDAARVSLEARLATVAYWLPLAARQIDDDIEKVHQLRVATRRAIAALELYRDWLPRRRHALALAAAQEDSPRSRRGPRSGCAWPNGCARSSMDNSGRCLALVADERAAAQPKIMAVADQCEEENRFRRKMYGLLTGRASARQTAEDAGRELSQLGRDAAGAGGGVLLRRTAESEQRSLRAASVSHSRQAIAVYARAAWRRHSVRSCARALSDRAGTCRNSWARSTIAWPPTRGCGAGGGRSTRRWTRKSSTS